MTAEAGAAVASVAEQAVPVPDAAAAAPRVRRRWSLQARLMATITAIVALIVVGIALATGAILGQVLRDNLDAQLVQSLTRLQVAGPGFPGTLRDAATVLADGYQEPGTLLVLFNNDGPTGAYIGDDGTVHSLDAAQIEEVVNATSRDVTVTGLGGYHTQGVGLGRDRIVGIGGIAVAEVQSTISQILTTVALVTAAGLLVLVLAIAVVVRTSLRPLRAVAETATRVASLPLSQGSVSIAERVPAQESDPRTEIGRVGAALNTLLDHVDESLDARQRNEERMRQFVADASHELRTPLASIRGYSELSLTALRRETSGAVETTETSLERIQAQSLRMTALVEDLLLLARLDEGQELVYGAVDLTRLVVEATGDARPAGPDHRWALDVGGDPILVIGDESRLHQVVANLVANARTHTPTGTLVTVSLAREGSDAVIRVHDDGPGVDPAVASELFTRFARADRSRARLTGGTGLGLSIARAIVEAHHGAIAVESRPGDTTFEVRLPIER